MLTDNITSSHAVAREKLGLCPSCGKIWEPKVTRTATQEVRGTRAYYTIQKNCDACHEAFIKEMRGGH